MRWSLRPSVGASVMAAAPPHQMAIFTDLANFVDDSMVSAIVKIFQDLRPQYALSKLFLVFPFFLSPFEPAQQHTLHFLYSSFVRSFSGTVRVHLYSFVHRSHQAFLFFVVAGNLSTESP